jgi:hypothetical protein
MFTMNESMLYGLIYKIAYFLGLDIYYVIIKEDGENRDDCFKGNYKI